jgi:hypothetical protein
MQDIIHMSQDADGGRRALFEQFLRCLDREENLVHYRLTWGLQWNVACFAAFFLLVSQDRNLVIDVGMIGLAIVGVLISIISFIGVSAAQAQSQFLIEQIEQRLGIRENDWSQTEFIRPYGDPARVHKPARRVSILFPLSFAFFWILGSVILASRIFSFEITYLAV